MHSVTADLRRALTTRGFFIGLFLTPLVMLLGAGQGVLPVLLHGAGDGLANGFHASLVMEGTASDAMLFAAPILCALPYTVSFVDDMKSGYIKSCLPHRKKVFCRRQGALRTPFQAGFRCAWGCGWLLLDNRKGRLLIMKKKVCMISITILLIILAAGCQLTPEKAIVSAKNQDDMLKMAMEPNGKEQMSLPEAYDIPKEYHNELLLAEGKLVCTINAPVLAPNVTHIPIVRVTGVDFAESELVTMAKVFFGETPIYKIPGTYQMTKSEIEESILYYKQLMKDLYGESAPEHPEVEALEKLYQTAPDTYIPELWDGTIWTEPLIIAGKDYGKEKKLQLQGDLGKNESARFSGIFNPEFTETIVPDSELYSALSVYTGASVSFANMDDNEALFYANSKKISSLDEIPSQAVGALQMKPRDALNIAQACLDSIGAKNLLPVGDVYLMSAFDENSQKTNCAYKLHFSSGFKGIPAAYIGKLETGGFGSAIVEDGTYDKYWDYETLQLLINDTGILYFKWTSPHEIGDTLVENAKLLSFNEIQSIFEKMIRNQYEAVVKEGLQYIEEIGINVDLVQLGFMRTIEQNSIEQGLMVPAWLFYGTRTDTMSQEYIDMGGVPEEYYGVKEPLCLMAINAVDGSIIDSTKGY